MRAIIMLAAAAATLAACDSKPAEPPAAAAPAPNTFAPVLEAAVRKYVDGKKFCIGEVADPAWEWRSSVRTMQEAFLELLNQ